MNLTLRKLNNMSKTSANLSCLRLAFALHELTVKVAILCHFHCAPHKGIQPRAFWTAGEWH
jgi:hypothetical protein